MMKGALQVYPIGFALKLSCLLVHLKKGSNRSVRKKPVVAEVITRKNEKSIEHALNSLGLVHG